MRGLVLLAAIGLSACVDQHTPDDLHHYSTIELCAELAERRIITDKLRGNEPPTRGQFVALCREMTSDMLDP
jgi:hypothetical protein